MADEDAETLVGKVLADRWTVDRLLGKGTMAAVFEAHDRDGERVAVKVLERELCRDPRRAERFLREARTAGDLAHPCVVGIDEDTATEDGRTVLVMELIEGETLGERLRREGNRLALEEILRLTERLLDALAAAHQHDLIHGDIKPDNLLLPLDGALKVLNFGMARLREHEVGSQPTAIAFRGTPAMMAPEQARARWEEVDARTDIWAVGATMFTLLTGEPVHDGATAKEQLASAMTTRPRALSSLRPDLPPEVLTLVDRALKYDRVDRWPTARDMQYAVRHAYEASQGTPLSSPRASRPKKASRRSSPPAATPVSPLEAAAQNGHRAASKPGPSGRAAVVVALAVVAAIGLVAAVVSLSGSP